MCIKRHKHKLHFDRKIRKIRVILKKKSETKSKFQIRGFPFVVEFFSIKVLALKINHSGFQNDIFKPIT